MRRVLLVGLLWMAAGVAAGAQETPLADRLNAYLRRQADSGFTGSVLVAVGDRLVLHRAYGLTGARHDTGAAFWIGSNTKQFTAAAVLRLQEQGRLSVRDTVGRFFPDAPADKRGITLHQLLTHSAGFGHDDAAVGVAERARAVRAVLALQLRYPPGQGYTYTNDDYVLLAAVVEVAARRPFEAYVRDALLRPAGMAHSGFWGEGRDAEVAPAGPGAASPPATMWRGGRSRASWGERGATGLFSTTGDLLRWLRALRAGRVLADSSVRALWAPQLFVRHEPPADVSYGYGWGVETVGGRAVLRRHFGTEWLGHNSAMRILDDGAVVVIVLSNAGQHGTSTWSSEVSREAARMAAAAAAAGGAGRG